MKLFLTNIFFSCTDMARWQDGSILTDMQSCRPLHVDRAKACFMGNYLVVIKNCYLFHNFK